MFGALSLLLNGGGVNQLKTITRELNAALGGREPGPLHAETGQHPGASDLDDPPRGHHQTPWTPSTGYSSTLATRKDDVGTVLTDLSPGLKTLEQQRGSSLTMLRSLDTLSGVASLHHQREQGRHDAARRLPGAVAPTPKALADAGTGPARLAPVCC